MWFLLFNQLSFFHFVPIYRLETFVPPQDLRNLSIRSSLPALLLVFERQGPPDIFKKLDHPAAHEHTVYHLSNCTVKAISYTTRVWDNAYSAAFSHKASDFWQDRLKATFKTSLLMVGLRKYSTGNLYQAGLSDKVYH